jgi:methionyl-tRNA synthetase
MPYANGPVHLGHLAGAQLPADIYARWLAMLIGRENVLFVCGTDEHGSTSEIAAMKADLTVRDFIDGVHDRQARTLGRYHIGLDVYAGTSRPDTFPLHRDRCQDFLRRLHAHGLLEKRTTRQWFDPKAERFLPDRFVRGRCPNPKCDNTEAYSDECDRCGSQHEPSALLDPRSTVSDATPVLRDTTHWHLDMAALSDTLRAWLVGKQKTWRPTVLADVLERVQPAVRFSAEHEATFKALKATLPKHKIKYAPGKQVVVQFERREDLAAARDAMAAQGIPTTLDDAWGTAPSPATSPGASPSPTSTADLAGKTLYVWPDSLIAPISFCEVALRARGEDPSHLDDFWRDPDARIYQFLGQDNVFFYVLMQGALWLGTQRDPHALPAKGDLQMTEVFGCAHLLVNGEKMSKSLGNFFTGDQLLDEMGFTADQVRYHLAHLGLAEKPSDFDLEDPRRAQPLPRRAPQRGLREAALGGPLEVRRARARGQAARQGPRGDGAPRPALRQVHGALGPPEPALRNRALRPHHQQPLHAAQAARRPAPRGGPARRALHLLLRAQDADGDAPPLRARHDGAAARVAAAARDGVPRRGARHAHPAGHELGPKGQYFPAVPEAAGEGAA